MIRSVERYILEETKRKLDHWFETNYNTISLPSTREEEEGEEKKKKSRLISVILPHHPYTGNGNYSIRRPSAISLFLLLKLYLHRRRKTAQDC